MTIITSLIGVSTEESWIRRIIKIVTSVTENGSVIMLLGTLLFVTFAALYFSAIPLIQEIGIGVGLGVLIDTFISWPLFIPAIMRIIRKYNWWPSKLSDEP